MQKQSNEGGLVQALTETVQSAGAVETAMEYVELGIDAMLEDGVIKDIPFIGTLVSIAKVGVTVRDRIFVQKLLKFLSSLNDVPAEARRDMVRKLEADVAYGRRVGEHLIEVIDRIDSQRKPHMVAKVFSAYVEGKIDATTLHYLNHSIERIPFFLIGEVRFIIEVLQSKGKRPALFSPMAVLELERAGMVVNEGHWGGAGFTPTEIGEKFLHLNLDRTGL